MTQVQQQGAVGAQGVAAPSVHPSPHLQSGTPLCYCPESVPAPPGALGRQGDVHFCRKSWWGRG